MNLEERKNAVLALYKKELVPMAKGGSAGSRNEGKEFKEEMRKLLASPGFEIESAIGKSSDGKSLDGNAVERTSYKMLRFKKNPMRQKKMLVIAFNSAFESYSNPQIGELREQASYLNGLDDRAQILLLVSARDYKNYLTDVFS